MEQEFELIVLIELEVPFLVVGIYQQKPATSLVERIDEPSLYKTENVASQMLALEILANSETTDHDCRITAVYLFAGDVLLNLSFARSGNFLDAVIGKRKNRHQLSRVIDKRKTIILAKQLFALQKGVFREEIIQIVVPALE